MSGESLNLVQPEPENIQALASLVHHTRSLLPVEQLEHAAGNFNAAIGRLATVIAAGESQGLTAIHSTLCYAGINLTQSQIELSNAHDALGALYADLVGETPQPATDNPPPAGRAEPERTRTAQPRKPSPREIFQVTHGFALYTDANDRLMERLSNTPVPRLPQFVSLRRNSPWQSTGWTTYNRNPSGFVLFMVMSEIIRTLPKREELLTDANVTKWDLLNSEQFTFQNGFSDIDFPWHFSAVAADAVADFFIDEGVITKEQKAGFTLHDWANIIGTGWFSRLIHQLALAPNAIYGAAGKFVSDYRGQSLAYKVLDALQLEGSQPLFIYKKQMDPIDGTAHHTAAVHPNVVRSLRSMLRQTKNSVGCPVARYSILLPEDTVKRDPHVQRLTDNGTLTVVPERSGDGKVRLTQEWSAIDKVLSLFAAQLDRYQWAYGQPVLAPGEKITRDKPPRIEHLDVPPVNVFCRDTPNNEENE